MLLAIIPAWPRIVIPLAAACRDIKETIVPSAQRDISKLPEAPATLVLVKLEIPNLPFVIPTQEVVFARLVLVEIVVINVPMLWLNIQIVKVYY